MHHASLRCLQCMNPRHYLQPLPVLHLHRHYPLLESQLENSYWGQQTPNWLEWGWSRPPTGNCRCRGRNSAGSFPRWRIWKPHMNYRCQEFEALGQHVTEGVSRCWKRSKISILVLTYLLVSNKFTLTRTFARHNSRDGSPAHVSFLPSSVSETCTDFSSLWAWMPY